MQQQTAAVPVLRLDSILPDWMDEVHLLKIDVSTHPAWLLFTRCNPAYALPSPSFFSDAPSARMRMCVRP
eukprot:3983177-Prymnesium_polylepis.1